MTRKAANRGGATIRTRGRNRPASSNASSRGLQSVHDRAHLGFRSVTWERKLNSLRNRCPIFPPKWPAACGPAGCVATSRRAAPSMSLLAKVALRTGGGQGLTGRQGRIGRRSSRFRCQGPGDRFSPDYQPDPTREGWRERACGPFGPSPIPSSPRHRRTTRSGSSAPGARSLCPPSWP